MRVTDVGFDEPIEGIISGDGPGESGAVTFGSAFGEGAFGAGNSGSELSAPSGSNNGSADSSSSSDEAPKKRRGRPPGSTAKSKPKSAALSESRIAAVRGKLTDGFSRLVGFGFSAYGVYRGNKYRKYDQVLSQRVYACYQLPMPAAQSVGEPLADTFIEWFPQWIEPAAKGIDPALAIGRLISVLQQTSDNEKAVVTDHYERIKAQNAPTNGNHPPSEETTPENPVEEWMNQEQPTAEEVLAVNIPTL